MVILVAKLELDNRYISSVFAQWACICEHVYTFLGIYFDLLAPISWIKRNLQKIRKNDMLQLVAEQSEDYPLESEGIDTLHRPLISEEAFQPAVRNCGMLNVTDLLGLDLSVYPISGTSPIPKQKFDFALYYAFNLTIFPLTMTYSLFAPLVIPVGAIYFGYNFL